MACATFQSAPPSRKFALPLGTLRPIDKFQLPGGSTTRDLITHTGTLVAVIYHTHRALPGSPQLHV